MIFPNMVYKCPGHHFGPSGSTYDWLQVTDQESLNLALSKGYFESLSEAVAGKANIPADDTAPTRAELEQKAKELAIHFDGRTGDAKLAKLIAEALA